MASETNPLEHAFKHKTTGMLSTAKEGSKPMRAFFRKFNNDWATTFSGALAYSLLTAMLPIAIAIVAIVGFFLQLLSGQQHSTAILDALNNIPGLGAAQKSLVQSVTNRLSEISRLSSNSGGHCRGVWRFKTLCGDGK